MKIRIKGTYLEKHMDQWVGYLGKGIGKGKWQNMVQLLLKTVSGEAAPCSVF